MIRPIAVFLVVACLPAFGDFSYEQSSKITGGMMAGMMKFAGAFSKQAREPMVNTVAVKGNRMLHGSQHHATVIDLDKETITDINFDKKQYSVMTFAQMKEMLDQMSQKMNQSTEKMKQSPDGKNVDVHYKVSVKDTGEKKTIAGFDTHQMIMTFEMEGTNTDTGNKGGMMMTTDMWLAPKVDGYNEIADFYKRMGRKLDWAPGNMGLMGARPDMAKGMAEIYKESAKLNGMPVFQIVKMGVHAEGQPQAGGQAQAPPPQQQDQQAEKPSIGSVLGGRFGGFGKKKKTQDDGDSAGAGSNQQGSGDASGALMEMTMEMSAFSASSVDESRFAVPVGFKQVEAEAQHRRR